jgi:hypothetical protein
MIRLAGMTSIFPDWTLAEGIAALKRHGYDALEARVEWRHGRVSRRRFDGC